MNDRDDLTPPPDEPMPEQARARIRADLLRAGQADDAVATPWRRWVVPGLAAAAVLLVAGFAGWAVQGGDGTSEGGPAGGTAASSAPAREEPSEPPSEPRATPSEEPSVLGSEQATTTPADDDVVEAGSGSCDDELTNVLPGAKPTAAFPEAEGGTTTFWVKGNQFVLCDIRGGTTTVHRALPLSPSQDVETFRVSSVYTPDGNGGFTATRVAGGVVPDGAMAYDVSYTFPDGHTEPATTTVDPQGRTWWRMVYSYPDDGGNEMNLPPIRVTLSLSGAQQTYDLDWGPDTCAQANHGC